MPKRVAIIQGIFNADAELAIKMLSTERNTVKFHSNWIGHQNSILYLVVQQMLYVDGVGS